MHIPCIYTMHIPCRYSLWPRLLWLYLPRLYLLRLYLLRQLLALVPEYPPAAELALDMLRRLGSAQSATRGGGANELIMQHLLQRGQLLAVTPPPANNPNLTLTH
jgi:hypothetical protein